MFVCRDRPRARECARRADLLLCACRAYPGDYPHAWEYHGRRRIMFAAERDVHEGILASWSVRPLPVPLRDAAGEGVAPAAAVATTLAALAPAGASGSRCVQP